MARLSWVLHRYFQRTDFLLWLGFSFYIIQCKIHFERKKENQLISKWKENLFSKKELRNSLPWQHENKMCALKNSFGAMFSFVQFC